MSSGTSRSHSTHCEGPRRFRVSLVASTADEPASTAAQSILSKYLKRNVVFNPSRFRRRVDGKRHGAFRDRFRAGGPVSEGRMAQPRLFETKRKKAPSGTSSGIRDVSVAETKGFEPSRRFPVCTLSRGVPSTTRPRLRRSVYGSGNTETRPF